MNLCTFALSIWMHSELGKCLISKILPNLMDEFRFNQFITIEGKLGMMEMTNVVKHLNYAGYLIGFSQKESNKYQGGGWYNRHRLSPIKSALS